jgi:hypothetical protein
MLLLQYAQQSVGFSASFFGNCSVEPRKAPFDCSLFFPNVAYYVEHFIEGQSLTSACHDAETLRRDGSRVSPPAYRLVSHGVQKRAQCSCLRSVSLTLEFRVLDGWRLSPESANPLSLCGQRAGRHSAGHSPEERYLRLIGYLV